MIHKPNNEGEGYVISSHHKWLPGIYDSERAANYAFRFPIEILQNLTDKICSVPGESRFITMDDLRLARKFGPIK